MSRPAETPPDLKRSRQDTAAVSGFVASSFQSTSRSVTRATAHRMSSAHPGDGCRAIQAPAARAPRRSACSTDGLRSRKSRPKYQTRQLKMSDETAQRNAVGATTTLAQPPHKALAENANQLAHEARAVNSVIARRCLRAATRTSAVDMGWRKRAFPQLLNPLGPRFGDLDAIVEGASPQVIVARAQLRPFHKFTGLLWLRTVAFGRYNWTQVNAVEILDCERW